MRKTIFTLHLYAALLMGVFIIISGVTGSVMAFQEDIDRLLNPRLFNVKPAGARIPVQQIQAKLAARYPGQKFDTIGLSDRPGATYTAQVRQTQYFVNPYTGELAGTRTLPTLLTQVNGLHLRLLMGKTGSAIVTLATFTLLFLLASGVYLWFPFRRWRVRLGASSRRIGFDLHLVVGIYTFAFLGVLASTGIFVAFDEEIADWLYKATNVAPSPRMVPSIPQKGVTPIGPDRAIDAARLALPGTSLISVSNPPDAKGAYLVRMRFPEDRTPIGRSHVAIDQYSAKPLFVASSRTAPLAARTVIVNRAIHTGDVFGYPTKIVVSLSSLFLVLQTLTGYYLWWKKLRGKQAAVAGQIR